MPDSYAPTPELGLPAYVPLMPVLKGDMEGMRHLSDDAQRQICPYFVIMKPRKRSNDRKGNFALNAADEIVDTWRFKGRVFVELFDEPAPEEGWFAAGNPQVLLFRYIQNRGVVAIPAISIHRDGEYRSSFLQVARTNAPNGLAVRIYFDDIESAEVTLNRLGALISEAGRPRSEIDLLLDLRRIRPERYEYIYSRVLRFLEILDREEKLRRVILVGTSIPEAVSTVPENDERDFARLELRLWRQVNAKRGRARAVGLGDYVNVRPEYDDRQTNFSNMNGKISYTLEEVTRLYRGQSRKKVRLDDQYVVLSQRLVSSGVFKGEAASWGDLCFSQCASGKREPGMPWLWIARGLAQHVELAAVQVTEEFARLK